MPEKPKPSEEGADALFSALNSLNDVTQENDDKHLEGLGKNGTARKTLQARNLKGNLILEELEVTLPSRKDFEERMGNKATASKTAKKYNPEEYRAMLGQKVQRVEECYAQHSLDGSPGKITVDFSIRTSGQIQNVKVLRSSFQNARMHTCIASLLGKMKVDSPPWDGFQVSYGFRFGARRLSF